MVFAAAGGQGVADASGEPPKAIRPHILQSAEESSQRRLAGTVMPGRESRLAFAVPGTVESVAVEIGDRVAAGDRLATLDAEPYRLNAEAARADLANAQATLSERREHFERQRRLLGEGWVSEARFERAEAQFETAQSEVERAERQLDLAQRDLADTAIEAPFNGRISARMVEPFQEIAAGQPVLEIQNSRRLEIRVLVSETLIRDIRVGDPVRIDLPAIGIFGRAGHVRDIGSRATAANAFPAEIEIGNPEGVLPGMTAEVTFDVSERHFEEETFLVPPSAILAADEVDTLAGEPRAVRALFAYRAEEGRIRRVPIEIRDVRADMVAVSGPLAAGDVVAATGVEFLHDGQRVTLLEDRRKGLAAPQDAGGAE